jgi:hypothetical protein
MLFALRQPALFLGLVLGFAASMVATAGVTRLLSRKSRHPKPFWDPQSWLDPYGAVAALLGGTGWAPKPEIRRGFGHSRNQQLWLVALIALVVPAALGAGAIAGYAALAGRGPLTVLQSMWVLHGDDPVKFLAPTVAEKILLGFGVQCLAVGVLSVIPIPPLATGVAAWTIFPRTDGARRLAYRMLEEYWGIVALLVLILLPLASEGPLLLFAVTSIIDSILHAL